MSEDLYTRKPQQIVMYSVDWCPDCKRARAFFERNQIQHLDVNVDHDARGADFVKEVNQGSRSVPTIVFPDGAILVEPSDAQLEAKFPQT